ncbi:MAG: TRAP transporter large permease [Oscillospiraceae bacterium]
MTAASVGVLALAIFLIFIIGGSTISLVMFAVGIFGYAFLTSSKAAFSMVAIDFFSSINSYNMSVIGMFSFMGYLAMYSGIGSRLYDAAYKFLGHSRGGLAVASEAACAAFGAVCGSGPATTATIASIAYPEMKKHGYDATLYTSCVAAGGGLGLLIPPSMGAIVYGIITGASIGKLFIAGIGAGLLLMVLYMIVINIQVRMHPEYAPVSPRYTWKERFNSLGNGLWEVVIIFAFSIGGITLGWFTPTEGGAMGAFAVLALVLLMRQIDFKGIVSALLDTVKTVGMVLLLVAAATTFGRFIALAQIPSACANWIMGMETNRYVVLLIITLIYLMAGCFVDMLPMIMLTVPIFYPIIVDYAGFDAIWFGVFSVLVSCMGMITPPVGVDVYVAKGVAPDVKLETIFKGVWWYVGAIFVCIFLVTVFPQIILWLPNLLQ